METINTINQVLENFSNSISLPSLSLNENNSCILQLDGSQNIQIIYDEDKNSLNFFTEIGQLPEQDQTRCCDYLLKSNSEWSLTQGTTLSKKKDQNSILLGYQLPVLQLSITIFEKILEHFIQQTDTWKSHLQQLYQGILPQALAEL